MTDEQQESLIITSFISVFGLLFFWFTVSVCYKAYTYNPEDHVFGNTYKIVNINSDTVLLQTVGRYTEILAVTPCTVKKDLYKLGDTVVSHYNGLDKDGKKEQEMLLKKLCEAS